MNLDDILDLQFDLEETHDHVSGAMDILRELWFNMFVSFTQITFLLLTGCRDPQKHPLVDIYLNYDRPSVPRAGKGIGCVFVHAESTLEVL
jgi:hypothetical protein